MKAPGRLFTAQELTASAKLVWMIRGLLPGASITDLAKRSGLTRPTVRSAVDQFEVSGWDIEGAGAERGWITMPPELLLDTRQQVHTRLTYGFLQLVPGVANLRGHFRVVQLAALMGVSPTTAKFALRQLHNSGWVRLAQKNKLTPTSFTLLNPAEARRQAEVEEAKVRITEARWEGQALMREWLTLLVDSDIYEDDAKLALLKNPYTDKPLEFDRYYPPCVAFEFQGPQHYGPTDLFPDQEVAWKQQARDYLKAGICATKGIQLRRVGAADLSLQGMVRQVGDLLPLRDLADHGPLLAYLEKASESYRRRSGTR